MIGVGIREIRGIGGGGFKGMVIADGHLIASVSQCYTGAGDGTTRLRAQLVTAAGRSICSLKQDVPISYFAST